MSDIEWNRHGIMCDHCGIMYGQEEYDTPCWMTDSDQIEKMAEDDCWQHDPITGRHLCPDCADQIRSAKMRAMLAADKYVYNGWPIPTDDDIRNGFDTASVSHFAHHDPSIGQDTVPMFDLWLAEHDRQVAERTIDKFLA